MRSATNSMSTQRARYAWKRERDRAGLTGIEDVIPQPLGPRRVVDAHKPVLVLARKDCESEKSEHCPPETQTLYPARRPSAKEVCKGPLKEPAYWWLFWDK